MEKSDNDWYAMSDKALLERMGYFIKQTRLQQNKTQQQVADAAGIARSTLVQIENGSGGKLISFIQVLRTLEELHLLRHFEMQNLVSPLELAKLEQAKRQRARRKNGKRDPGTKSDW